MNSQNNQYKRFNEDLSMIDVDLSKTQKINKSASRKGGSMFNKSRKSNGNLGDTNIEKYFSGSNHSSYINHQDFDPYQQQQVESN